MERGDDKDVGEKVMIKFWHRQAGRLSGCLRIQVIGWVAWVETAEARLYLICNCLHGWSCGDVKLLQLLGCTPQKLLHNIQFCCWAHQHDGTGKRRTV
jgi:hypothetical protein